MQRRPLVPPTAGAGLLALTALVTGLGSPQPTHAASVLDVGGKIDVVATDSYTVSAEAVLHLMDAKGALWQLGPKSVFCAPGPGVTEGKHYYHQGNTVQPPGGMRTGLAMGLDPSGDGVRALFVYGTSTLSLVRLRCGQEPEVLGELDESKIAGLLPNPAGPAAWSSYFHQRGAVRPADGALCVGGQRDFVCLKPGKELVADVVVSHADFAKWAVTPLGDVAKLLEFDPAKVSYAGTQLLHPAYTADGRLIAVAKATWQNAAKPGQAPAQAHMLWVVDLTPAGQLTNKAGPEVIPYGALGVGAPLAHSFGNSETLTNVRDVVLDEAAGHYYLWPHRGWRFTAVKGASPRRGGLGVAVVPIVGSGLGHLELAAPLWSKAEVGNAWYGWAAVQHSEGLGMLTPTRDKPIHEPWTLFHVQWDAATIDLDEDGLSAAEETKRGTSNLRRDSDGGGLADGVEALLYGTDPTKAADDVAGTTQRRALGDGGWSISTLLRLVPAWAAQAVHKGLQPWPSGWVCSTGSCTSRAGTRVELGEAVEAAPSESGKHAVGYHPATKTISRWTLPGGVRETVVAWSELAALAGNGPTAVLPGRGEQIFVQGDDGTVVVGAGPPKRILDIKQASCDAGLGACWPWGEPPLELALFFSWVHEGVLLGFDPVLDRALVGVNGGSERWVIAVALDKEPVAVARSRDLPSQEVQDSTYTNFFGILVPVLMAPLPGGGFLQHWRLAGDWLWWDHLEFSAFSLADGTYLPYAPGPPGLAGQGFAMGFGSIVSAGAVGGPLDQMGSAYELVATSRRLEPGDVLVSAGTPNTAAQGPGIYAIHRQGGAAQVVAEADLGIAGDGVVPPGVIGLDVAADGRICAVSHQGKVVVLSAPDATTHIPGKATTLPAVQGASDCAWTSDNKLLVLRSSPAEVATVDPATGQAAATLSLAKEMSTPARLAVDAAGRWHIADLAGPLACVEGGVVTIQPSLQAAAVAVGAAGKVVVAERPSGKLLEVDAGCVSAPAPTEIGFDAAALHAAAAAGAKGVVEWQLADIAVRPDGLIVVTASKFTGGIDRIRAYVVDRQHNTATWITPFDLAGQQGPVALALVPGGTWTTTWDAPGGQGGADGGGGDAGGGTGSSVDTRDDSGCSVGAAGSRLGVGSLGLLVGLLLLLRVRSSLCSISSRMARHPPRREVARS